MCPPWADTGPRWHPHGKGLSVQEGCNGRAGTYLPGMLLQFHFYFLSKLWDQLFLISIWLPNSYWASFVNCVYLNIKQPQQRLPSAQPCICHWFVIDAPELKQAPLLWNQFTALPFCFEAEGFKHDEFVWTFESVDLINLWDHLCLGCGHQIKLELLSTWFEVIDGDTQAVIYLIKLMSIKRQYLGSKSYSSMKNGRLGFNWKYFPNDLFMVNAQKILTISLFS